MPGKKYASIKNPKKYEALKKRYGKARAAAITNGTTPGKTVRSARAILRRKRGKH
jgi:hypothetical protein